MYNFFLRFVCQVAFLFLVTLTHAADNGSSSELSFKYFDAEDVADAIDEQSDDGVLDFSDGDSAEEEKPNRIHIDTYLEPLEETLNSNLFLEYSTRVGSQTSQNIGSAPWSFFVSNFSWVTQALYPITKDVLIRPSLKVAIFSAPDLGQTISQTDSGGVNFQLRESLLHFIFNRYGIVSLGRGTTFDRMATDFLSLSSGVNDKFYQNLSGVRLYNKENGSYMGVVANGNGSFDDAPQGTGIRLFGVDESLELFDGISYTLPLNNWLLQIAYADTPGNVSDQYLQLGWRYTYDALWARWSMLGIYASSWPYGCQVVSTDESIDGISQWNVCQATGRSEKSPFRELSLGSKFSLGYVDGSVSYKLLFDEHSQAQAAGLSAGYVHNYYGGLNYTFMDAFEFGPLSIGLGLLKQNKFTSLIDQSLGGPDIETTDDALPVNDSRSWGVLLSASQKLGRNSGFKLYLQQLGFSAMSVDHTLKIKASPVRAATISFYTQIDQWVKK